MRNVVLALTLVLVGCNGSDNLTEPHGRAGGIPTPAPTPAPSVTHWAGNLQLVAAGPPGSCQERFLMANTGLLAQTATATEEQFAEGQTRFELVTSGEQACEFSGSLIGGELNLAGSHETCRGPVMSPQSLWALWNACQGFDPVGDGPYFSLAKIVAQQTRSTLYGRWNYSIYDPGGGGVRGSRWDLTLVLDMSQR